MSFNKKLIESRKGRVYTVENYIDDAIGQDVLSSLKKKKQDFWREYIKILADSCSFREQEKFFQYILGTIDRNPPYLVEILYMNFFDSKENTFIYFLGPDRDVLKIISPFLTQEFHYFFSYFKNRLSSRNVEGLSKESQEKYIKIRDSSYSSFNLQMIEKTTLLAKATMKKLKEHLELDKIEIGVLLERLIKEAESVEKDCTEEEKAIALELKTDLLCASDSVILTDLSFWEKTRNNFNRIYSLLRQTEEINDFLSRLLSKSKIRLKSIPTVIVESVEIIPELDEIFIPNPIIDGIDKRFSQEMAITHAFIQEKRLQLQLWQERVQQRKEQRMRVQELTFEDSSVALEKNQEMNKEQAQKLLNIFENIDKKSKQLFNSMFEVQEDCKPHNVRFNDIGKLIRQMGGSINQSGSSHFSIQLPNTFLNEAHIVTTGGSYKPHQSDEWTHSAHKLCKEAFTNAGITPERLAIAQKMMSALRNGL